MPGSTMARSTSRGGPRERHRRLGGRQRPWRSRGCASSRECRCGALQRDAVAPARRPAPPRCSRTVCGAADCMSRIAARSRDALG